jgi:hypothetical protein
MVGRVTVHRPSNARSKVTSRANLGRDMRARIGFEFGQYLHYSPMAKYSKPLAIAIIPSALVR